MEVSRALTLAPATVVSTASIGCAPCLGLLLLPLLLGLFALDLQAATLALCRACLRLPTAKHHRGDLAKAQYGAGGTRRRLHAKRRSGAGRLAHTVGRLAERLQHRDQLAANLERGAQQREHSVGQQAQQRQTE